MAAEHRPAAAWASEWYYRPSHGRSSPQMRKLSATLARSGLLFACQRKRAGSRAGRRAVVSLLNKPTQYRKCAAEHRLRRHRRCTAKLRRCQAVGQPAGVCTPFRFCVVLSSHADSCSGLHALSWLTGHVQDVFFSEPMRREAIRFWCTRRLLAVAVVCVLACAAGCEDDPLDAGRLEHIWGRRGISAGRLQKPRCMDLDAQDRLYIVDMTARIQVFTAEGEYLRGWQTPDHRLGRPSGITVTADGQVLVADTHYNRILIYSPEGRLLRLFSGRQAEKPSTGKPGELGLVTCAIRDAQGNFYISEYGEYDRIQKFSPRGEFLLEWGGHGTEPGRLNRPQKMALDEQQRIWVADACNHRIQVFDTEGRLLFYWGKPGSRAGELYYPYDLDFDPQGNLVVCEFGNHRVQKFTREGQSLGCWGRQGRGPGELHNPWAVRVDSRGRIHVLDTNNHRLQRIVMR